MTEISAIKNSGKLIKDDIYYIIKNGEISFFYNELLLFKHNKNNPVISVVMTKGDTEKEIPLVNYDINKININEYNIDFYYQVYKVKVNLKLENNVINVKVNNYNRYYAIKISLKNSVGKIRGFGLNKEDNFAGKEIKSNFWNEKERYSYSDDKVLSFFKDKKYFLSVEGNYEWKTRLGSLIEMYFKKTHIFNIKVVFCKEKEEFQKQLVPLKKEIFNNDGIVIKTTSNGLNNISYLEKTIGKKISTIIICDDSIGLWSLRKIRENLKKKNIKIIRKVQMKISENDDYFKEFNNDDFIKSKNNKLLVEKGKENFFYFDLSNSETCRKVKNYIRRILGTNIDGLLSIEKENKIFNREEYKEKLKGASLMWQTILYEASLEYIYPKTLIFDTLTSVTHLFGFYQIDGKKIRIRYKKYFENLKNSGIFNTVISFNFLEGFIYKRFEKKLKEKYNIIY